MMKTLSQINSDALACVKHAEPEERDIAWKMYLYVKNAVDACLGLMGEQAEIDKQMSVLENVNDVLIGRILHAGIKMASCPENLLGGVREWMNASNIHHTVIEPNITDPCIIFETPDDYTLVKIRFPNLIEMR